MQDKLIARVPFFYGWVLMVIAIVGMVSSFPGHPFAITLLLEALLGDLQLQRTTVSMMFTVAGLLSALTLTYIGKLLDKHGARVIGTISMFLIEPAVLFFSHVYSVVGLFLAFLFSRILGTGVLQIFGSTVVAQWFSVLHGQIQYQLTPDGKPVDSSHSPSGELSVGWTLSEARGTSVFWVYTLGRTVSTTWGCVLIFHQVSIFREVSESPTAGSRAFSLTLFLTDAFSAVSGKLLDRIMLGKVLSLELTALVMTFMSLIFLGGFWALFVFVICFSITMGNGLVFDGTVWATIFGRQHQGAICAFSMTVFVILGSFGSIIYGLNYDGFGTYHPAMALGSFFAATFAIAAYRVRLPVASPVFATVAIGER